MLLVRIREYAVEHDLILIELFSRHLEIHRANNLMALRASQPWRANAAGKISTGYLCGESTCFTRVRAGSILERFCRALQTCIAYLFEARHTFASLCCAAGGRI